MMQQVAPGQHSMAHYAFASAIMNLGVMLPGMISGWLCDMLGYEMFFIVALVMSVPSFIMAKIVPFTHPDKTDDPASEIKNDTILAEESTVTQ